MKNRVREYRMKMGMSQRELALTVGLTRQTIGLIETFKYNPSLKVCLDIVNTLGQSLDVVFNPNFFS
ncbi:helix-turn-helix transcriptional regulator [uncultured Rummeliibacillus sp.]|uniref:helix-turn-helix transcriptional regulator n=1 Tax=uncultured Rummeliibacillus sp. TaxID=762292 RepID=UPI002623A2AB|nr:helix-turn-helix transcriptional regulator [uncultured Rummeliibacillus sp.]